jgi:hypothetical protein
MRVVSEIREAVVRRSEHGRVDHDHVILGSKRIWRQYSPSVGQRNARHHRSVVLHHATPFVGAHGRGAGAATVNVPASGSRLSTIMPEATQRGFECGKGNRARRHVRARAAFVENSFVGFLNALLRRVSASVTCSGVGGAGFAAGFGSGSGCQGGAAQPAMHAMIAHPITVPVKRIRSPLNDASSVQLILSVRLVHRPSRDIAATLWAAICLRMASLRAFAPETPRRPASSYPSARPDAVLRDASAGFVRFGDLEHGLAVAAMREARGSS